jgi:ProP effector
MRKQALHPRTAVINQKQKNLSKKARLDALAWLTETFPNAFDNSVSIQPLSLGIMQQILQHADEAAKHGISKSKLREAVVLFTRRIDYLTCLKAREMRVDLMGVTTEPVSEEDAEQAATKIRKRIEKNARMARQNAFSADTKPSGSPVSSPTDFSPSYPEREPAFSAKNSLAQSAKTTTVMIKHKTSRNYDPSAVARLKEKLGLSRRTQTETQD